MIRVHRSILVVLTVAIALFTVATAGAVTTTAVRIPSSQLAAYESLGIVALSDIDYGSFRWLVLDQRQLDRLSASGIAYTVVEDAGRVQVMDYRFDPLTEGEPTLPQELRADPDRPGLRLLQMVAPVRDEWIDELERLGITLLQYYPHNTFLVWSGPALMDATDGLPFLRWHGLFHPAYKIGSNLEGRAGAIRNVDVMFYNDGMIERTLDDLRKHGAVVLQHYPSQPDRAFFNAIVVIGADQIDRIAAIPTVLWMGYESTEPILDDEMSDQIVAGNHPGGVPVTGYTTHLASLGYDGTGVIWAPIDTGVDYDHPDLGPNIIGGYSFPGACDPPGQPGSDCSGGGHGTHVAGIIGGDATGGFTDPQGFLYGLGVAPGYSIFTMNSLSASAWPPTGGWQEHSKRAVLGGAIGGNNSWTTGEGTQHGYQASERTHDFMVRDGNFDTAGVAEPFIEVFSAGNSGSSGLTAPKEAKNLIVTASSVNYRAGNIDLISGFSSRGPAVDGRWVPTIAAPGEQIASSRNDLGGSCSTAIAGTNNLYAYCSGTSMAAPHTSGVITVATEWWRTFNAGADPSPAMAKALLVNSAVDMAANDIPNIHEGWGRINLTNLIEPGVNRETWDQTVIFDSTGEQFITSVGVPNPGQPLRISLAWSDAPGAVGANPALVNNLDLTVETGGGVYHGNVFSGGWSTTGGSADTINNLENVFVAVPGGSAIITVDATAIVGDGVPFSGDTTDQDFALVCSNCALEPDFILNASPVYQGICAPANADYAVDIGSLLGYSDPVTLSASGNPAGTTLGFSTNPVIPPGASTMTIGNTGAATAGSYPILVVGVAPTSTHQLTVELGLFTGAPAAPSLVAPADGAVNVPARPTFEWSPATQGESYRLQVANDAAFTSLVIDESGITDTQFTPASDLGTSSVFYWRVVGDNPCGPGAFSPVFSFSTEALPGDCGIGTMPVAEFFDDLEGGAPGWALGSGSIGNTWALSGARSYSGATSYYAVDPSTVSDQRLDSPSVALPVGASPLTLQFWNWQLMEDSSGGCWDGGEVEISTDGGSTWTPLPDAVQLTDPYDGPVTGLGGLDGWCDDLGAAATVWKKAVVDISSYAGATARFRFRLGSDSSVSREGWYIDDIKVQSCMPDAAHHIFSDDFETGTSGAWSFTAP